jgi:hypothetical protein
MSAAYRYIAEVRNSQEITLYGSADLDYWERKLRPERLVPVERDGQARLLISAVSSCWLGVRFREFLIAVEANPKSHSPGLGASTGLYLLTAYNTSRPFAFIEQRYFQTPYSYGIVEVQCGQPTSFRLQHRAGELVYAERMPPRSVAPKIDESWEGAIYLPPRTVKARIPGNLFYAKLSGLTEITPFRAGADTLRITPSPSDPILSWLLESGLTGREWHVRSSATHSRSKTYPRD